MDRLLDTADRGLVDRHPLPRTHLRVRGADGRQDPHRLGSHLRPQPRLGTSVLTQVSTINKQIEGVVGIVNQQKQNVEQQVSKVAKQYGLVE